MRPTLKLSLAALTSLALLPTTAAAIEVYSPINGTVTATTYYSTGSFHGAVDISSNDRCNLDNVLSPLAGSYSWSLTIRTTGIVCNGNGSGNQNEAKHTLADGRSIRLWHFIKTADSYSRTCDRCALGTVGATGNATSPHVHIQVDKLGTNDTSWYKVVRGQSVTTSTIIGYL